MPDTRVRTDADGSGAGILHSNLYRVTQSISYHPKSVGGGVCIRALHGFGFASALTSAGLPQSELPWRS